MEDIKVCKNCGKEIPIDSDFCQYCGSDNVETITENKNVFCRYCGKEIPDDSEFCQYCGCKQSLNANISYERAPNKRSNSFALFFSRKTIFVAVLSVLILATIISTVLFLNKGIEFANGEIVSSNKLNYRGGSAQNLIRYELEVKAPKEKDVYVYIRPTSKSRHDEYVAYLVKRNLSYWIYLPAGSYEAFYAVGNRWYGEGLFFGFNTIYYYDSYILNTRELPNNYSWLVKFEPMDNSIIKIRKSEFPK